MKIFLIVFSFTFLLKAQDKLSNGNGVGNGGDAVVCRERVEILDFVESRLMKRYSIISDSKKLTFMELAKERVSKLRGLDTRLFEQYTKVLSTIADKLVFIENAQFRDVPDSFEIAIPAGCKLEQLAIQQEIDNKTMIHISKKLWEKMDDVNRAGLILHEIIYEHLLTTGEVNSIKVRKLNSLIFSGDIDKLTAGDFKKVLRNLGVKIY